MSGHRPWRDVQRRNSPERLPAPPGGSQEAWEAARERIAQVLWETFADDRHGRPPWDKATESKRDYYRGQASLVLGLAERDELDSPPPVPVPGQPLSGVISGYGLRRDKDGVVLSLQADALNVTVLLEREVAARLAEAMAGVAGVG